MGTEINMLTTTISICEGHKVQLNTSQVLDVELTTTNTPNHKWSFEKFVITDAPNHEPFKAKFVATETFNHEPHLTKPTTPNVTLNHL